MTVALIFSSNSWLKTKGYMCLEIAHSQHKEHQQSVIHIPKIPAHNEVSGFYFCLHSINNIGEECQLMDAPSSLHDSIKICSWTEQCMVCIVGVVTALLVDWHHLIPPKVHTSASSFIMSRTQTETFCHLKLLFTPAFRLMSINLQREASSPSFSQI